MRRIGIACICVCALSAGWARGEVKSLRVAPDGKLLMNDQPVKVWGFRVAGAVATDAAATQLLENLQDLKGYGVNTLLICCQGSTGQSVKAFSTMGGHSRMSPFGIGFARS